MSQIVDNQPNLENAKLVLRRHLQVGDIKSPLKVKTILDALDAQAQEIEGLKKDVEGRKYAYIHDLKPHMEMATQEIASLKARLTATEAYLDHLVDYAKNICDNNCKNGYKERGRHAPDCWLVEVEDWRLDMPRDRTNK